MNILFLCDEYPPCTHGGIGSVIQNLARELTKQGQQVFVCGFYPYYRKGKEIENDEGVKVFRKFYGNNFKLKCSHTRIIKHFINIKNEFVEYTRFIEGFIEDNCIDIIEIPDFNEAFRYSGSSFISFPKFKIPTIVKLHGTYSMDSFFTNGRVINNHIFNKEKHHIHNADKVIAVSEYIKNFAIKTFEYNKDISVIYNGAIVNDTYKYSWKEDSYTVVYAGRLSLKKGIISLIKAWPKVIEQFSNAKLKIYGQQEKETTSILNSLLNCPLNLNVDILGFIPKKELLEVYSTVSCAIFPSYIEPFGMTPVEAMSVGCPVIFTKRATGKEIVNEGVDGLLVDPDNIVEIANTIIWMLTNRKEAENMGKRGYEKVKEKFGISKIADENLMVYKIMA
jgi:glycogen synthase